MYLYGAIVWLRMVFDVEKKTKHQNIKKFVRMVLVYILSPFLISALLIVHIYMREENKYLVPTIIMVLVHTLISLTIFLYCSSKLLKYWDGFELPENRCANNVNIELS